MSELIFDQEAHTYTEAGKRLVSVTQVVRDECGNPNYASEFYLNRGTMIHKAVSLYLQGRLDESSLDERIRARVESAKKAIREMSIVMKVAEIHLSHKLFKFAGTPDLLTDKGVLIDWKSAHDPVTTIPQMGGYVELLSSNGYPVKKCYEIVLADDKYTLYEYKPQRCRGLFLAFLTVYQFKENGI